MTDTRYHPACCGEHYTGMPGACCGVPGCCQHEGRNSASSTGSEFPDGIRDLKGGTGWSPLQRKLMATRLRHIADLLEEEE